MSILHFFHLNKNMVEAPGKDSLYCPVTGRLMKLEDVNDECFSKKIMGEGFAVYPEDNVVGSPLNGVVTSVFPTKHAITIKGENGCELLIHIGIDTVSLNGRCYDCKVEEGDDVKAGQVLAKVDFNHIKKCGYDITTMVTVCNSEDYWIQFIHSEGNVRKNDNILKIRLRGCENDY